MKKITVLILFVVIVISFLSVFCGCDKRQAQAISIFDNSTYTLPITPQYANWHGNGTYFVSELTLNDIKRKINSQEHTHSVSYQNGLLIEKRNDVRIDYYILEQKNEGGYDLAMPYFISNCNELILYPKHFFIKELEKNEYFEPVEDKTYVTTATIDDFVQFYVQSGVFRVTKSNEKLLVEWNEKTKLADSKIVRQGSATFKIQKYKGHSFWIEFSGDKEERKVSYNVVSEHE